VSLIQYRVVLNQWQLLWIVGSSKYEDTLWENVEVKQAEIKVYTVTVVQQNIQLKQFKKMILLVLGQEIQ
jgi:hypothetical protein